MDKVFVNMIAHIRLIVPDAKFPPNISLPKLIHFQYYFYKEKEKHFTEVRTARQTEEQTNTEP